MITVITVIKISIEMEINFNFNLYFLLAYNFILIIRKNPLDQFRSLIIIYELLLIEQ